MVILDCGIVHFQPRILRLYPQLEPTALLKINKHYIFFNTYVEHLNQNGLVFVSKQCFVSVSGLKVLKVYRFYEVFNKISPSSFCASLASKQQIDRHIFKPLFQRTLHRHFFEKSTYILFMTRVFSLARLHLNRVGLKVRK